MSVLRDVANVQKIVTVQSYGFFFLRNPMALAAVFLVALSVLITNDAFATALNDQLLRLIRKMSPHTALQLRAKAAMPASPLGTQSRYRRAMRPKVHILTLHRSWFILICLSTAAVLLRVSAAWVTLAWGTLVGLGIPLLHASCRNQNLKVKMVNAKDDFKAAWKEYQQGISTSLGIGGSKTAGGGFGVYGTYTDFSR